MKTFIKLFQTMVILAFVFAFASMTGSPTFAASATVSVGVFSAIMHINGIQGMAFEAPVIPDFTALSKTEINELSEDDYDAYVLEKEAHRAAEIELKFYEQTEKITALEDADSDENKQALDDIKEKMEEMLEEHKAMYLMIRGKSETPKEGEGYKTMGEAILAKLIEKKEDGTLEKLISGDVSKINMEIETKQIDIGVQNTIGAGATQNSITEFSNIISPIRKRELRYMANVTVGTVGTDRVFWIEEFDELGTPIMLAEAATKTKLSVNYEEQVERVKKIAVTGKITTEFFADLPQLVSFVQTNLMKRMDIVLEDQLFSGDGTGNNLLGGITVASAFTGGGLAGEVDDANDADVIEAIRLQSEEAFHTPNAVFVHPSTIAGIRLLKGSDGHYLIPRFVSDDQMNVGGMRLISTTAVAEDVFLGGDLTTLNVRIRSEIGFEIGLSGTDFEENLRTILTEKRLVQFISVNDTAGLITATFTAAKAALETP